MRGLVFGVVTDKDARPVNGAAVIIGGIHGEETNGTLINFTVQKMMDDDSKKYGGRYERYTNGFGLFTIPFTWDSYNADNYMRVAQRLMNFTNPLDLHISLTPNIKDGYTRRTLPDCAGYVIPDDQKLISFFKAGKSLGDGQTELSKKLENLTPDFKKAIKGEDFDVNPFPIAEMSVAGLFILGIARIQL